MRRALRPLPALVLSLSLAACAGDEGASADGAQAPTADAADAGPSAAAPEAPSPEAPVPGDASLSAGDIAALEAGIAAENAALATLAADMPSDDAQYAAHVLEGMAAAAADGARTAGMDEAGYRQRKESLYVALGAIEMRAMLEAQAANMDTTGLDDETIAGMRRQSEDMIAGIPDPYAGLDGEAADALRGRLDALMALRAANIGALATLAR